MNISRHTILHFEGPSAHLMLPSIKT